MNSPNNTGSNENEDSMKNIPETSNDLMSNEVDDKFKSEININNPGTTIDVMNKEELTNEQSPRTKEIEEEVVEGKKIIKEGAARKEEQTFTLSQYNISLMKAILGTGSLAIPFAIQYIGVIPLVIIYVIFALWNVYSSWQLTQLKKHMDLHPTVGKTISNSCIYAKLSYNVLGMTGYYIFLFCFLLTLWGFQIGILIIMVDFLNTSYQFFFPGSDSRLIVHIVVSVLLLITLLLSNLKVLVFLSSFGLFALAFSFAVVFIYGFMNYSFSIPENILFPRDMEGFFGNLGIMVFSLAYMPVFLSLYSRITPRSSDKGMSGTLFSVCLVTFMYILIGVVLSGLYSHAEGGIKDVIINNLPSDQVYTTLVNICMSLTLLGNFPVYYISIAEVLETFKGPMTSNSMFITHPWYIGIRTLQLVIFSLIGYIYPKFSDILSLLGGFCNVAISFILPPLLYIIVFSKKSSTSMNIFNGILTCIGVIIMCICTYYNFVSLTE